MIFLSAFETTENFVHMTYYLVFAWEMAQQRVYLCYNKKKLSLCARGNGLYTLDGKTGRSVCTVF